MPSAPTNYERILRIALTDSNNRPEANFLDKEDGVYGEAKFKFEHFYKQVLSEIPWSFATSRRSVRFVRKTNSARYPNEFELPTGTLFLWDIYPGEDANRDDSYYRNNPFSSIALALSETPDFLDQAIDISNGRIRSGFEYLTFFITHSDPIPYEKYSEPFIKLMAAELTLSLRKGKGTSVEHLDFFKGEKETARNRGLKQGSVENQGPQTVQPTRLVSTLRTLRI